MHFDLNVTQLRLAFICMKIWRPGPKLKIPDDNIGTNIYTGTMPSSGGRDMRSLGR